MAGFVYIMSNPSFADGRIKIGMSKGDPDEDRKSELNTTGVPEDFRVEYSAYVQNHHELEKTVHKHFHSQRPNKNREFFTCSIMDAITAIQDFAGETLKHEDNYYAKYEELKREREEEERKQQVEQGRLGRVREEEERKQRAFLAVEKEEERRRKLSKIEKNRKHQKNHTKISREYALKSLQRNMEDQAHTEINKSLYSIFGGSTENRYNEAKKFIECEIREIEKNLEHSQHWEEEFAEQKSLLEEQVRRWTR
jgi:hypothetical protein